MLEEIFGSKKHKKEYDIKKVLKSIFFNKTLDETKYVFTNYVDEINQYQKLQNNERSMCNRMSLLFNPHRLDTNLIKQKKTMFDVLANDENFYKNIERVLKLRNNENFNSNEILNAFSIAVNGIGVPQEFPPFIARYVYKHILKLNKTSSILDPCSGWGGRMIGASTVVCNYVGFDPSTKTFNGLLKLFDFLKNLSPDFNVTMNCLPFEQSILEENSFDGALTSPPYFNTELYSSEETNSLNNYNQFDDWVDKFYLQLITKTMFYLKPGKSFILNIGNRRYPLDKILLENFSKKYEIEKLTNFISNHSKIRGSEDDNEEKGELFFKITK